MDIAGLGFSIVAEARTITQSIARRMENFRQGRKAFDGLSDILAHLTGNIEKSRRAYPKFFHMRFRKAYAPCSGTFGTCPRHSTQGRWDMEKELSKALGEAAEVL